MNTQVQEAYQPPRTRRARSEYRVHRTPQELGFANVYTSKEAAKLLGISLDRLYRYVREERLPTLALPGSHAGRRHAYRFTMAGMNEFLIAQKQRSTP